MGILIAVGLGASWTLGGARHVAGWVTGRGLPGRRQDSALLQALVLLPVAAVSGPVTALVYVVAYRALRDRVTVTGS
ncbi:MAG: hypothetical protein M3301_00870 [Chloroflexota bacterium]|nr:hypothetical protein [Chloroflexota bacterium]